MYLCSCNPFAQIASAATWQQKLSKNWLGCRVLKSWKLTRDLDLIPKMKRRTLTESLIPLTLQVTRIYAREDAIVEDYCEVLLRMSRLTHYTVILPLLLVLKPGRVVSCPVILYSCPLHSKTFCLKAFPFNMISCYHEVSVLKTQRSTSNILRRFWWAWLG